MLLAEKQEQVCGLKGGGEEGGIGQRLIIEVETTASEIVSIRSLSTTGRCTCDCWRTGVGIGDIDDEAEDAGADS